MVIQNISMQVGFSEIVAVIGHNGAGKSTLLRALFGLLSGSSGAVRFDNTPINRLSPRELLRLGIMYIPQGNRVFPNLTVRENLVLVDPTLHRIERVFEHFPVLRTRFGARAGVLSGGERQMLAFGRVLMMSPKLLLLDEPSLGLAPSLVRQTLETIRKLNHELGIAIVMVEQRVREALRIAHGVYVLKNGVISYSGPADSLSSDEKLREVYF